MSVAFNPGELKRWGIIPSHDDVGVTLRASDGCMGDNSPTVAIGVDSYNQTANHEVLDTIRTSGGGDNYPKVCVGFKAGQGADGQLGDKREVSPTVPSSMPGIEPTVQAVGGGMTMQEPRDIAGIIARMKYIVRRLTPTECERLMGLPDGWTIPSNLVITDELVLEFTEIHDRFNRIVWEYDKDRSQNPPKPKSPAQVRKWLEKISNPLTCPDAPRYKGCGNGWAANQPRWIILRMIAEEEQVDNAFHAIDCTE